MDITRDTLTLAVLPYITEEDFQKLYDATDPIPLVTPVTSMTLGDFIRATTDDNWVKANILSEEYLIVAIGRLKQFRNEVENIDKFMKLNECTESTEESQARKGVYFCSAAEEMLLDAVTFFHLHSMDEAEKVPLSDYLVYYKHKTAEAKFQRNLSAVYAKKNNTKQKRK